MHKKWLNHQISNFEYLMELNFIAGRSYNCSGMYFVFPQILNYEKIQKYLPELKDEYYRDLNLPIGALNEKRLSIQQNKFDFLADSFYGKHLYGEHFSNIGSITHYLVRIQPFTKIHRNLQKGKFDCPDRIFQDIEQSWLSCISEQTNYRELIPEFYYYPNFLKNINQEQFGKTQLDKEVNHVVLPLWVQSKLPEEFVFLMRQQLESQYVTKNLSKWIDLIFGVYQNSFEKNNIFLKFTYEEEFQNIKAKREKKEYNDMDLTSILTLIENCGVTPHQLFQKQLEENQGIKIQHENVFNFNNLYEQKRKKIKYNLLFYWVEGDQVTILTKQYNLIFSSFHKKIEKEKKYKLLDQLMYMNTVNHKAQFCKIPSSFAENMIIFGGFQDGQIGIFNGYKLNCKSTIHFQPIVFIAFSQKFLKFNNRYELLILASREQRISAWKLLKEDPYILEDHQYLIFNHESKISHLKVNDCLKILVTIGQNNDCMISSISNGKLLQKFQILNLDYFKSKSFLGQQDQARIIDVTIHNNGLILVASSNKSLMLYNLNGELLQNHQIDYNICKIKFINDYTAQFLLSNYTGNILKINAFELEQFKNNEQKTMKSQIIYTEEKANNYYLDFNIINNELQEFVMFYNQKILKLQLKKIQQTQKG